MLLMLLVIIAFTEVHEATTATKKVEIRIFDRNYNASETEVERLLSKATLEQRGYKKTTQITESTDDEGNHFLKIARYLKTVPCQDMPKVEQELRKILPGVWGRDVAVKVREEALNQRVNNKECTAGIEIHFHAGKSCGKVDKKRALIRRFAAAGCKSKTWCLFCFAATIQ